jgi:hypothetical protein
VVGERYSDWLNLEWSADYGNELSKVSGRMENGCSTWEIMIVECIHDASEKVALLKAAIQH